MIWKLKGRGEIPVLRYRCWWHTQDPDSELLRYAVSYTKEYLLIDLYKKALLHVDGKGAIDIRKLYCCLFSCFCGCNLVWRIIVVVWFVFVYVEINEQKGKCLWT